MSYRKKIILRTAFIFAITAICIFGSYLTVRLISPNNEPVKVSTDYNWSAHT